MAQCSECKEDYSSPYHFAQPGVCNACAAASGQDADPEAVQAWYGSVAVYDTAARGASLVERRNDPATLVRYAGWLDVIAVFGAMVVVFLALIGAVVTVAVAPRLGLVSILQLPFVLFSAAVWFIVFRSGSLALWSLSRIERKLMSAQREVGPDN